MQQAIEKFRNAHLWLLIPFAIAILGFMRSYWLQFTEVPWRQHLHGLTATAWFILLLVQPYLITRGKVGAHRRYGMLALILAGGVVVSALGAIPYNLVNPHFPTAMAYGLSFIDIVVISGFAFSVVMAVWRVRHPGDHARWMISTVFWSLFPGLFRLAFVFLDLIFGEQVSVGFEGMIVAMGVINLAVLGLIMYLDRQFHPAWTLATLGAVVYIVAPAVGAMAWWQSLAGRLFSL